MTLVLIALVCLAVYSNTLFMDFVWDDLPQIKENVLITSLENIPRFFTTEVWKGVKGGDNITPYYRPVFTLSLALDYFFWKLNPFGYHLTNILLHLLVTAGVYILSVRLLKDKTAALFSGLVFSVHPVHSEAVSWISARNESLAALFMFSSFYLYILFKEKGKVRHIGISLVLFFLALLSKEMAITLPALLFLFELCFGTGTWKKKLKLPVLYGTMIVPYLVARTMVLDISSWQNEPVLWRIYTSIGIVANYLRLLILPVDLKVFYDIPVQKTLLGPDVIIPLLLLSAVFTAAVVFLRKYDKRLFFGLLWIFIAIIPVSGLPVLLLPAPMAERYLYMPSAGFAIAVGAGLSMLMTKTRKAVGPPSSGLKKDVIIKLMATSLIFLFFILNFQRNYIWKDQFSFANNVVKDAPNYPGGHNDLGVEYVKMDKFDEAIREFQSALSLRPEDSEALNNLSIVYRKLSRYDEAIKALRDSVRINPRNAKAFNSFGLVYTDLGRFNDAIQEFNSAIKIELRYAELHNNLGVVYIKQGRFDEALKEFELALQIEPRYAEVFNNLGVTYLKMGKIDAAKREFQNALRIRPDYVEANSNLNLANQGQSGNAEKINTHYSRANELLSQGRFDEAIKEFRIALKQRPNDAEIYNNMGAAYVKMGRLGEAAKEFENALRFRTGDAAIHYNLGLIYMKQGKMNESVAHLKIAVSLSPGKELFKKTLDRAYELRNKS